MSLKKLADPVRNFGFACVRHFLKQNRKPKRRRLRDVRTELLETRLMLSAAPQVSFGRVEYVESETLDGATSAATLGWSITSLGDITGDDIDDFAVGAPRDIIQTDDRGQVLVYSGADRSVLTTLVGAQTDDLFGFDIAKAGDINGDGNRTFMRRFVVENTAELIRDSWYSILPANVCRECYL